MSSSSLADPSRVRPRLPSPTGKPPQAAPQPVDEPAPGVDPPNEVLPGRLWIGGAPVDFAWSRRHGIDVVLDLADPGPGPQTPDLAGLDYRKCPLVDADELPDDDQLRDLVTHVVTGVRAGRRVLVHCSFGKNRSGLVVTLAVRELLELSGADAVAHVRARRHRAVNNTVFAEYVEGLPAPTQA